MLTLFYLVAIGVTAAGASSPSDWYYVAAVVDYAPPWRPGISAERNMMRNVKAAGDFMANASAQNADIIVFPEMGLVGFANTPFFSEVPDPQDAVIPCVNTNTNTTSVIRKLSCLAIKHKLYLVVNLPEKFPCDPEDDGSCPYRGEYHYNTNVVFDRSGVVVARYRKWNLYGEPNTQTTPSVEYVTFDTDFGVKFGTFVCFDILFEQPSINLVRKMQITDIAFTTAWFSDVPFLTSLQTQAAWAHAMDVNLIASGYNYPPAASGGSGLYRGKNGPIETVFDGIKGRSTLLVQKVPKKGHWPDGDARKDPSILDPAIAYCGQDPYVEMQNVKVHQDKLNYFNTSILERPKVGMEFNVERTLCSGELCCDFRVKGRGVNPSINATDSAHCGNHLNNLFGSADIDLLNLTDAEDFDWFDGFYYRLVVFQGRRRGDGLNRQTKLGLQVCGVISCLSEELDSCGYLAKGVASPRVTWTEFSNITISGHFMEGRFYMPDTLVGPRYKVLPPSAYHWDDQPQPEGHQVLLQLQRSVQDLRTFGIYGRVFNWDKRVKPSS